MPAVVSTIAGAFFAANYGIRFRWTGITAVGTAGLDVFTKQHDISSVWIAVLP